MKKLEPAIMGKRTKLDNPIDKARVDDHGDLLKMPNPIENA